MGYLFLVIALIFNATANILMKLGARRLESAEQIAGESLVSKVMAMALNPYLIVGVILFASNVLFYIIALKKIKLSVAYPIMSSGGVLVITAFSLIYLREQLHSMQVVGIVFIAAGIALLTYFLE
ncbi:MAG: EamA family transporter [Leptospiraceae bacterium]|nr:EamA family transporter [Leptospiraceae bacterium]MCB1317257.1 EamA family transporter [Leptospiraceae bacterium]